ncbi:MAG: hypothetical protein D6732_23200 [Methanobacteriota archaeon]|nr:MAG: hypothetical protein D6732_23200 [Euryarchaeota archaeon]
MNMLIIFNPHACEGRAYQKMMKVMPWLEMQTNRVKFVSLSELRELNRALQEQVANGDVHLVVAGGDGTVHHVLNILIKRFSPPRLKKIILGAVGLGSSNDFHKPITPERQMNGIPLTVDFNHVQWRDVMKVVYQTTTGRWKSRYVLLNASCGITAQANWLFNHPDAILHFLKKHCTPLAILYAALKTIFTFRGITVEFGESRGSLKSHHVANIAIVKSPHCSGSFCYDSPYSPQNGRFWVHICYETRCINILKLLIKLAHHRFMGEPGTKSLETSRFFLRGNRPFALEMDGEVVEIQEAHFEIVPKFIRVCQQ